MSLGKGAYLGNIIPQAMSILDTVYNTGLVFAARYLSKLRVLDPGLDVPSV